MAVGFIVRLRQSEESTRIPWETDIIESEKTLEVVGRVRVLDHISLRRYYGND